MKPLINYFYVLKNHNPALLFFLVIYFCSELSTKTICTLIGIKYSLFFITLTLLTDIVVLCILCAYIFNDIDYTEDETVYNFKSGVGKKIIFKNINTGEVKKSGL